MVDQSVESVLRSFVQKLFGVHRIKPQDANGCNDCNLHFVFMGLEVCICFKPGAHALDVWTVDPNVPLPNELVVALQKTLPRIRLHFVSANVTGQNPKGYLRVTNVGFDSLQAAVS